MPKSDGASATAFGSWPSARRCGRPREQKTHVYVLDGEDLAGMVLRASSSCSARGCRTGRRRWVEGGELAARRLSVF